MKRLCLYIGILVLASASLYSIYLNCSLSKKVKSLEARLIDECSQKTERTSVLRFEEVTKKPYGDTKEANDYMMEEQDIMDIKRFQDRWDAKNGDKDCVIMFCSGAGLVDWPDTSGNYPGQRLVFRQMTIGSDGKIKDVSNAKYSVYFNYDKSIEDYHFKKANSKTLGK